MSTFNIRNVCESNNIKILVKLEYLCRLTKFPNYIGYEIKRSYFLSPQIKYFYFMFN